MSTETSTQTLAPTYSIAQRTVGYADNDGRFVAERVRPNCWKYGVLHGVGVSRFLGVFDTLAEAEAAVAADGPVWEAEAKPVAAVR